MAASELLPAIALSEHSKYEQQESKTSLSKPGHLTPVQFLGLLQTVTKETSMQNILAVTHPFLLLPSYEIRCRQFVEMVNGTDSEVRCFSARSPRSQDSYPGSPSLSPRHGSNNSHVHSTGKCFSCVFGWAEQMLKVNCCILPYLLLSVLWNAPFLSENQLRWHTDLVGVSVLLRNWFCVSCFPQTIVCRVLFLFRTKAFTGGLLVEPSCGSVLQTKL